MIQLDYVSELSFMTAPSFLAHCDQILDYNQGSKLHEAILSWPILAQLVELQTLKYFFPQLKEYILPPFPSIPSQLFLYFLLSSHFL